ncbi:hypothetical protein LCL89_14490 [Halobacillus yeomjeoni]|uniref:Uncharacterized protein n=1 Tax=Halobacillus yeomjeoni TaxID=311194 RepID=A0A931HWD9_9BACI|nr:hypothetical protein [Halobacillus yeomjeoni]MBH0230679.1 hypothetical protein [Halobacillus yeomjeoni]MCA0985238.1 hypothetical protein [Halobacillus yeomjeoni]
MEQSARSLMPLVHIWLDDAPTKFTHAFCERLAYQWMVEIVNPIPIPILEDKEYVTIITIEQVDGEFYASIPIESYDVEEGNEFTIYRFFMYPPG